MKEMIKRVREDRGGFTLAELLIVVAIILVLVAIAIPVFTGALTKADQAVAAADIRAVKAVATTDYLLNNKEMKTAVIYSATVDKNGNISDLKVETEGTPTEVGTGLAWDTDNKAKIIVKITPQEYVAD